MHIIYVYIYIYIYRYRWRWNRSSLSAWNAQYINKRRVTCVGSSFFASFFPTQSDTKFQKMVTSTKYHKISEIELFELVSIDRIETVFVQGQLAGEFHLPVRPRWSSLDCQPLVFQHHPGRIEKRVQCRQIRPGGCQLDHMDKFTLKLFFASKRTTWREPLDLQQETTGDIFGPSWWFGTWILWRSHHIGNGKSSQLTPSFFRGVSSDHQPASNIIVNHH